VAWAQRIRTAAVFGVVAQLLRYPSGAARITVSIEGPGDGLPDLADPEFLATLQRRHE
jgi:hypothetical protein